jgi:hypothetical protein
LSFRQGQDSRREPESRHHQIRWDRLIGTVRRECLDGW